MLNIDIPSGYHISKGATNDFYILNDGEIFIRNLSKNLSDAKSKAEKLIKENDPDYFKDGYELTVNIWNRFEWKIEKKHKWFPKQFDHIDAYNYHLSKIRLENKKQELTKKYSAFSHIGKIGDKVDLQLTITEIFTYPIYTEYSDFPLTGYGHKFTDQNNNQLIYFGNSKTFVEKYKVMVGDSEFKRDRAIYKVGNKITVQATVKDHTLDKKDYDYETEVGMPVTVIARPKINKKTKERANG